MGDRRRKQGIHDFAVIGSTRLRVSPLAEIHLDGGKREMAAAEDGRSDLLR